MNRALFCSIWLFCFIKVGVITTDSNDTTLPTSVTKRDRKSTFLELGRGDIRRLRSLRVAVAQFVATYVSPETFRPTVSRGIYRRKKKHNRPYATSRSTKVTTKGIYKKKEYWPSFKQRRDVMYSHLLKVLSNNNEAKKEILCNKTVALAHRGRGGDCYIRTFYYFMKHCHYAYHDVGGMSNVKKLLLQACLADWLNTYKILRVLQGCCQERFKFQLFNRI